MAATPLLLLPGLMTDARVWDPLIHAAAAQRLIVIGQTHTADNMAELAAQATASMPDGPFAVAGFSLGGYVALELCRQLGERVAGLALIDTSARADTAEARQNRERMVAALQSGETTFAQTLAGFAPKLLHGHHAEDPRLVRLLEGMGRSTGQAGFIRQQTAAMHRQDARDVLKSLRCPALVLCGVDDQVTPPERSQEMADLLAGDVELVTVPSAGHMTTLEQPQAVVQPFLRWLVKVDAARDEESVV